MKTPVIEIKGLRTYFRTPRGVAKAVDGVTLSINRGETFALVGESGCGKSVTALSAIQLVENGAGYIAGGDILLHGQSILTLNEKEKRAIRGNRISMIFQEPMTSLNPVFTIGEQITEVLKLHQGLKSTEAKRVAVEMFAKVKLPNPKELFTEYPHRLSGGMRQRVMIAIALCCKPDLLIADEPTTALDVTIQDEIIGLIQELQAELGSAVLLITHNMALVYQNADHVGVMYGGKIVETAPARFLFRNPLHPYTIKLLRSIPGRTNRGTELETIPGAVPAATSYAPGCRFSGRCDREMEGCEFKEPELKEHDFEQSVACHLFDPGFMASGLAVPKMQTGRKIAAAHDITAPIDKRDELLRVEKLKTYYPVRKGLFRRTVGYVKAVDGIDLEVKRGSTLALVGESGCGKTTAGKSIIRLIQPSGGSLWFNGTEISKLSERGLKRFRSKAQIIFQDPYSSLNPRMIVKNIIGEGIKTLAPELSKKERLDRTVETLERVGLGAETLNRYPHEFSGGQRQRIGIARALAVDPEFIICDEAVSALDVSVQAQILNLLKSIQRDFGISYLFITHDLGVVEYIADEVAVMFNGKIVEYGPTEELFKNPTNDYTKKLLDAIPALPPAKTD